MLEAVCYVMNVECRLNLLPRETRQKVKCTITVRGTAEELATVVSGASLQFVAIDDQAIITFTNPHIVESTSFGEVNAIVGKTYVLQADNVAVGV